LFVIRVDSLSLIILSSFFYSYRHICHLHSFPTRRSSDLSSGEQSINPARSLDAANTYPSGAWISRPWCPFGFFANNSRTVVFLQDRKSTRLNSSHQIISYAVFCLKKKIKI